MNIKPKKKIVFLTGTRADFGKIKSLILALSKSKLFDVYIFATGMHMLNKYGYTVCEIEDCGFPNIYKYINYIENNSLDLILANTINGLNHYIKECHPEMIIVHGDRVEALAGAIVGSFNNIFVAHIEGGEISGTIDEHIRHAVSKLSHFHFVANEEAKKRLIQMGEDKDWIFIIGSPDIDIMNSKNLPPLKEARKKYEILFDEYALLLYHPVTAEINDIYNQTNILTEALLDSKFNYIVSYPNSDPGSDIIQMIYEKKLLNNKHFRIIPSIRFEYFLTFLKNAHFIIGNSSAGVRESPYYGIPSINIGSRQSNRIDYQKNTSIVNCDYDKNIILKLINNFSNKKIRFEPSYNFGTGNSTKSFLRIIKNKKIWEHKIQKQFLDWF